MKRYFVVLDFAEDFYPETDPLYAASGRDPGGRSSLADFIGGAMDPTARVYPTVYVSLEDLLSDRAESIGAFSPPQDGRRSV